MASGVRVGAFDLEVSVYTTDGAEYVGRQWKPHAGAFHCDRLVNGAGCEARRAESGHVSVENLPAAGDGARFRIVARHEDPVKAVKVALELPYMRMLAPECVDLTEGIWRQWSFPAFWRTGLAVWELGSGFFTLVTHDFPWHFKRLRALRRRDRMRLEIVQDANVRERSFGFDTSVWELAYRAEVDTILAEYGAFVRQAYGARNFERRSDVPDWVRAVGLVVTLHGTDWNGNPHLDFAGMRRAAETLAGLFPAERTILYPVGWDGRYMRDYPEYEPSVGLGGREGFRAFCADARGRGFHVMPHLNAMACSAGHRWHGQHLRDYVLRDWQGQPVRCRHIDWDHDGMGEAAHSYLSLVPPALRDILLATVTRLVDDYGIDAVFLDETCNVFYNDAAWDQVEGVRRLVRDLRRAQPELLIAGEEWNEMLLGLTPVVQIWEETADGRKGFGRERSALMRRWVGQFIRGCGYLALASPEGRTGVHEWADAPWVDERENEAYYIPTLALTGESLDRGMAGIRATVERARDYVERFVAS